MTDCGVCIDTSYDEGDGFEFDCGPATSTEEVVCVECQKTVPIGVQHERATWIDADAGPCSAETCAVCAEIAWAFSCQARIYFNLWEDITEYVFPEFSLACLEKLATPEAKAELQRRWIEWKGLPA